MSAPTESRPAAPAASTRRATTIDRAALVELLAAAAVLLGAAWLGSVTGWKGPPKTAISTAVWPFYFDTWFPGPVVTGRVLLPLLALGVAWWPLRRWIEDLPAAATLDGPSQAARERRAALGLLLGLCAAAWLVHIGCGIVRHGTEQGLRFTFSRAQEYWQDVRFVDAHFLARFPEVGALSQHGATHPPGTILLLAALKRLGFTGAHDAELLCSLAGAATALPLWGAARRLSDETTARWAVALLLFAGQVTAFSLLAMDMVTMLLGAVALYGLARALDGEWQGGVIWGLALAAASLCTFTALVLSLGWAVLLLPVAANLFVLFARARRRAPAPARADRTAPDATARPDDEDQSSHRATAGARAQLLALALGPAAFLAVYAVLVVAFDYRPVHVFRANWAAFALSDDVQRPLKLAWLGTPIAFLGALGLPLMALAARSIAGAVVRLVRAPRAALLGSSEPPAAGTRPRALRSTAALVLAGALPVAVCVILGKPRAEVERVWLLFVPAVVLGAAAAARHWYARSPRWLTHVAMPLMVLQSILAEVLFETMW